MASIQETINYYLKKEELIMWKYYENGKEETYSNLELLHLYQNIVDKQEYSCFTDWMYDMEKMQILIEY